MPTMIPAPSPELGSQPQPPLWLILTNISSACSITLRLATVFRDAMRPTPQFCVCGVWCVVWRVWRGWRAGREHVRSEAELEPVLGMNVFVLAHLGLPRTIVQGRHALRNAGSSVIVESGAGLCTEAKIIKFGKWLACPHRESSLVQRFLWIGSGRLRVSLFYEMD